MFIDLSGFKAQLGLPVHIKVLSLRCSLTHFLSLIPTETKNKINFTNDYSEIGRVRSASWITEMKTEAEALLRHFRKQLVCHQFRLSNSSTLERHGNGLDENAAISAT